MLEVGDGIAPLRLRPDVHRGHVLPSCDGVLVQLVESLRPHPVWPARRRHVEAAHRLDAVGERELPTVPPGDLPFPTELRMRSNTHNGHKKIVRTGKERSTYLAEGEER